MKQANASNDHTGITSTKDRGWVSDSLLIGSFILKDPETQERLFVASTLTEESDGCSSFILADEDGKPCYKFTFRLQEV